MSGQLPKHGIVISYGKLQIGFFGWCAALLFALLILAALSIAWSAPVNPSDIEVMDGDTVRYLGDVYRLVGCDAPETNERARCPEEDVLGHQATQYLEHLVRSGSVVDLTRVKCSCPVGASEGTQWCNWGRFCARLTVDGTEVCRSLIAARLARRYVCGAHRCPKRKSWCD